jgi:hypothetical protein
MMPKTHSRLQGTAACPYCHAWTYRLTYIPLQHGLLIRGECTACGVRGQSYNGPARLPAKPSVGQVLSA